MKNINFLMNHENRRETLKNKFIPTFLLTLTMLFTLGIGEMRGVQAYLFSGDRLYIDCTNWLAANARIKVNLYGSDGKVAKYMYASHLKDNYYYVDMDGSYKGFQICRMHPSEETQWNYTGTAWADQRDADDKYLITLGSCANGNTPSWSHGPYWMASGHTFYYNNSISQWSTPHLRVGRTNYCTANAMTRVAYTKYLYSVSTSSWNGLEAICIADKASYTGQGNSIYGKGGDTYLVTGSTIHYKGNVSSDMYANATATGDMGGDGVQYYTTTYDASLPTYSVTVSSASHCTVSLAKYTTDPDAVSPSTSSFSSGGGSLEPTQYIQVTVTPATGYEFGSLSITNAGTKTAAAEGTPGIYWINANSSITASCTAQNYTVTLDNQSAKTAGTESISVTFEANNNLTGTPAITNPERSGYTFGGYYTATGGSGTQIIDADGNVVASASDASYTYTDASKNWKYAGNITLYAKWTGNTYSITYKECDNTTVITGLSPTSYTCGVDSELPTPTKSGYTFDAWYNKYCVIDEKHGWIDGCQKTSTGTSMYGSVTCLAKWHQTVTLNMQGVCANLTPTVEYLGTELLDYSTGTTTIRSGALLGYYTAPTDGTKVLNADGTFAASNVTDYITDGAWTKAGATTLYAHWETISLPETLDISNYTAYGGGLTFRNDTLDYGTGASSHQDGYAEWKVNIAEKCVYHLTLNGYYPNCGQLEAYLINSSGTTVSTHTFTKKCDCNAFTLTETWNLSELSTTGVYTLKIKNVVAHGSPRLISLAIDPITVTYDANGGTCATSSAIYAGSALTLPSATKDGYVFEGWYNGSTKIGNAGGSYEPTTSITLTAKWGPIVDMPGTINKANVTDYSSDMTWHGTSDEYFDYGPTDAKNLGRWAKWEVDVTPGVYTISTIVDFPDVGSDAIQWGLILFDGADTVATYNSICKYGYKTITYEANWDLRKDKADNDLVAGTYTLEVKNIVEYGRPKLKSLTLEPSTFTVTLNNQGATTAGTGSFTVPYGTEGYSFGESIIYPSKTGYLFGGYYTETGGGGVQILDESGFINTSVSGYTDGSGKWIYADNVTLYAKWTLEDYDITRTAPMGGTYTIQVGDADPVSTSTTAHYGETITLAATGNDCYAFDSWTVTGKISGDAISVTSNQFTMPAEGVTVSASFSQKNLALSKRAYSPGKAQAGPAGANDGNLGTRNSTEGSSANEQYWYVDLGKYYQLNQLDIVWEGAYSTNYLIQAAQSLPTDSTDASQWYPIYEFSGTPTIGNAEDDHNYADLDAAARYLRITSLSNYNEGWGFSMWEFRVYGTGAAAADTHAPVITEATVSYNDDGKAYLTLTATDVEDITTNWFRIYNPQTETWSLHQTNGDDQVVITGLVACADYRFKVQAIDQSAQLSDTSYINVKVPVVEGANLALNKTVTAGTTEDDGHKPEKAVDGIKTASEWSGNSSAKEAGVNQWLLVDLGAKYDIDSIKIWWGANSGTWPQDYQIQVSYDGTNFRSIVHRTSADGTQDNKYLDLNAKGRYVRVWADEYGVSYGMCITELEVYGDCFTDDDHVSFFTGPGTDWTAAANWDKGIVPGANDTVRIFAPIVIPTGSSVTVQKVIIATGGTMASGTAEACGKLTIEAAAALIVKDSLKRCADVANAYTLTSTRIEDLHIGSSSAGNGSLVLGHHDGTNQAQVDFYTLAYKDASRGYINQHIGTPFSSGRGVLQDYYGSYLYAWDAENQKWSNIKDPDAHFTPFLGYNIMRKTAAAETLEMQGTLAAAGAEGTQVINLTYNGGEKKDNENVLANSWTAPIDIAAIGTSSFSNCEATIYIMNSGSKTDAGGDPAQDAINPGQWITIPVNSASWTSPTVTKIPSMQGFSVYATGTSPTLTLNYSSAVYTPALTNALNPPTRAPRRTMMENAPEVVRLRVTGTSGYADQLCLLLREDFSDAFDNGWDGHKVYGKSYTPQLFSVAADGEKMAVDCKPEIEGTLVGMKAGDEDEQYTMTFEYDSDEPLYMLDVDNNTYTEVRTGNAYMFYTTDLGAHNRFVLTRHAPQTPTGVENSAVSGQQSAVKLMIDNKIYILLRGVLYDATGKRVSGLMSEGVNE